MLGMYSWLCCLLVLLARSNVAGGRRIYLGYTQPTPHSSPQPNAQGKLKKREILTHTYKELVKKLRNTHGLESYEPPPNR
jgi:hypothetical protein